MQHSEHYDGSKWLLNKYVIREGCIHFLIDNASIEKLWNLIDPGHTKNFSCQLFPNFSVGKPCPALSADVCDSMCSERSPPFSELKTGQGICNLLSFTILWRRCN